jgi:hypothetical protein
LRQDILKSSGKYGNEFQKPDRILQTKKNVKEKTEALISPIRN